MPQDSLSLFTPPIDPDWVLLTIDDTPIRAHLLSVLRYWHHTLRTPTLIWLHSSRPLPQELFVAIEATHYTLTKGHPTAAGCLYLLRPHWSLPGTPKLANPIPLFIATYLTKLVGQNLLSAATISPYLSPSPPPCSFYAPAILDKLIPSAARWNVYAWARLYNIWHRQEESLSCQQGLSFASLFRNDTYHVQLYFRWLTCTFPTPSTIWTPGITCPPLEKAARLIGADCW